MSEIENFDIRNHIVDSIVETFDAMVSMELAVTASEPPDTSGVNRMVAAVNFAGNVTGLITIQVTSDLAHLMTANTLEIEPEEVAEEGEIKALLAEISNVVGGNLKSALNDAGHSCVISAPSLTFGADFSIKSVNTDRFERFLFSCRQETIIVEVGLKIQPDSAVGDELGADDAWDLTGRVDVAKVNALDIKTRVSEVVIDVFETMLATHLECTDSIPFESLENIRHVGSVSFAGAATGMVSIHVGDEFSRQLAAEKLGMQVEELEGDEDVKDMMGELGNMVGENLKSAFTDAGLACALSTPCFTTGTDFRIESLNMETYERLAFRSGDNIVFVEMGVKIPEAALQSADTATAEPVQSPPTPPPVQEEKHQPPEKAETRTYEDLELDLLLDIPLEIKVELGRTRIQIQELLKLTPGSAIKLVRLEGEPVDILANDTLIARGEVVVQKEKYGIRVTEITSRMERIRSFGI